MPPKSWTTREVNQLRKMAAEGHGRRDIAEAIGRTQSSIAHMCKMLGLKLERQQMMPLDERDAKVGSQVLRIACLDLFQRTARRYCISVDDAMACHLGYHARPIIPGCERAIRGQFAQRRLAA